MGLSRSIAADRARLGLLVQQLGLPLQLVSLLVAHGEAVREASDRLGLVSSGDRDVILSRHTADSLTFALARRPARGESWVDAGSGAGFPGLVLAICYPHTTFTLVEANAKKAGFLELQSRTLGLINTVIAAQRLEKIVGRFDVAVTRAFKAPDRAISALDDFVKPGGDMIIAAGDREVAPPGVRLVRPEVSGAVDSPLRLFMMTRRA